MMKPFLLGASVLLAACAPGLPEAETLETELAEVAADEGEAQPVKAVTASTVVHPDWSRDAVIYQINTRQYSQDGTFAAVEADLDRIQSLGVDILWLMPIHPIGEARRKGELGSPYAVADFKKVNPELGTEDDFRSLVEAAHARGMKVIIDWVANHTAWDNWMISQHPEWYTRGADGEMTHPPDTDWLDVADLDFGNEALRDYMREALAYWVEEFDIDGYRCDVAGMVPTDFWNSVRPRLDAVKPVFMLAEWQQPELHEQAFDASYAWQWKEIMQGIVAGENTVADLAGYYRAYQSDWPDNAMRMAYTDNHDQNTWDGLTQEIYGDAYEAAVVLSFTGDGIPLIYNGQECDNRNRLEFFERDPIEWNCEADVGDLFRELVQLKTDNPVLHNAPWGATTTQVENTNPQSVFSFIRRNDAGEAVLVAANLSDTPQSFAFTDALPLGDYETFRTGERVTIGTEERMLPAWGWSVHVRR
ncbi:MAG: alpha-amylase family glycosyl hydrolase [Litorimonas sp.]